MTLPVINDLQFSACELSNLEEAVGGDRGCELFLCSFAEWSWLFRTIEVAVLEVPAVVAA